MSLFNDKYNAFLAEFGQGRKMVLSTSENNKVSSRMMSVIQVNGKFYFQTDVTMKKYHQLKFNKMSLYVLIIFKLKGYVKK